MISAREALTRATDQLAAHPQLRDTALSDAVLLLLAHLGIDRATLIAHPERTLDRASQAGYQRLLERRLRFEPVQYILGEQEFFGLALAVTPAVLIPRPETELLVESVLARLDPHAPLRLADIGTGSGAIALALASRLPRAHVVATDLSTAALEIAQANAARHGLSERIRFVHADLLGDEDAQEPFDAIVSNPPYIPEGDRATLHPQVAGHEPASALFAGPDGLDVYRRLIPEALGHLRAGGLLALECGFGQAEALRTLLTAWADVELLPDLAGIPRVAVARRS